MKNCIIGSTIDEMVAAIAAWEEMWSADDAPVYTGGLMTGLRAAWYLGAAMRHEMPFYRESDHAVVFSIECDWQEEEELIARLKPVDFARKGKVMVFVCYKADGKDYSEAFREERLKEYRLNKGE